MKLQQVTLIQLIINKLMLIKLKKTKLNLSYENNNSFIQSNDNNVINDHNIEENIFDVKSNGNNKS